MIMRDKTISGVSRTAALLSCLMLCSCAGNVDPPAAAPESTTAAVETDLSTSQSSGTAQSVTDVTSAESTVDETTASETSADTESTAETAENIIAEGYREAYSEKLRELLSEKEDVEDDALCTYMFSVCDVGGDATPELLVSNGEYHLASVALYAYIDGKVEYIDDIGSYGEVTYMTERNGFDSFYGGMGAFSDTYLIFDGKKLENKIHIESYIGYDYINDDFETEIEEYHIDDETVTKEEYDKAYKEYFTGNSIGLGRHYYANEYGISAVFGDTDCDTAFDDLILSLPPADEWGSPSKMITADLDNDAQKEVFLFDDYRCMLYRFDNGIKFAGDSPTYSSAPYDYFDMSDLDVDHTDEEHEYHLYVQPETGTVVFHDKSLSDEYYISRYKDGVLAPTGHYQKIKLTDGSFVFAIDGKGVEETEYEDFLDGLFADGMDDMPFDEIAVG